MAELRAKGRRRERFLVERTLMRHQTMDEQRIIPLDQIDHINFGRTQMSVALPFVGGVFILAVLGIYFSAYSAIVPLGALFGMGVLGPSLIALYFVGRREVVSIATKDVTISMVHPIDEEAEDFVRALLRARTRYLEGVDAVEQPQPVYVAQPPVPVVSTEPPVPDSVAPRRAVIPTPAHEQELAEAEYDEDVEYDEEDYAAAGIEYNAEDLEEIEDIDADLDAEEDWDEEETTV